MNTDSTAVQQAAETFFRNIDQVLVGKRDTIELVFVALLCEGHVLLEDVPGVGKTMLSQALAQALGLELVQRLAGQQFLGLPDRVLDQGSGRLVHGRSPANSSTFPRTLRPAALSASMRQGEPS